MTRNTLMATLKPVHSLTHFLLKLAEKQHLKRKKLHNSVQEQNVCTDTLISNVPPPPSIWPHLFCGAGHEKRRGEQLKWTLAFRLYIGSFVFHVRSYQNQFIQPGWAECVLFSLGLHFVCLYCFSLFVCPYPFVFP